MIEEAKEKYKKTGKCEHVLLPLYENGPYHGCVVCGEPIA